METDMEIDERKASNEADKMQEPFRYSDFSPDDPAHPDLVKIFDYWRLKRQDRFAPSWSDIKLMDMPTKLIPTISVVDVHAEEPHFTYRFWGSAITTIHKYDLTGKSVLELQPESYARVVHEQYTRILATREPQGFLIEVPIQPRPSTEEVSKYRLTTYYPAVRMPLSSNGQDIDMMISILDHSVEYEAKLKEAFKDIGTE